MKPLRCCCWFKFKQAEALEIWISSSQFLLKFRLVSPTPFQSFPDALSMAASFLLSWETHFSGQPYTYPISLKEVLNSFWNHDLSINSLQTSHGLGHTTRLQKPQGQATEKQGQCQETDRTGSSSVWGSSTAAPRPSHGTSIHVTKGQLFPLTSKSLGSKSEVLERSQEPVESPLYKPSLQ